MNRGLSIFNNCVASYVAIDLITIGLSAVDKS